MYHTGIWAIGKLESDLLCWQFDAFCLKHSFILRFFCLNRTCKAWNDVETANRTTHLIVNVAPTWKIEPRNVNVVLGKSVSIDCLGEGSPNPRISWKKSIASSISSAALTLKNDFLAEQPSEFKEILSSFRHQIYANGTFVIQEVDKADAGYYMCKVMLKVKFGKHLIFIV